MYVKRVANAALVTAIWLLPTIFLSCLLDQLMPKFKKDEKKSKTILLTVIQIVLSFLLFEGVENAIRSVNKGILREVKMPELVNGAIILGLIQSNTQKTLGKRIGVIYDTVDRGLEKVNIGL